MYERLPSSCHRTIPSWPYSPRHSAQEQGDLIFLSPYNLLMLLLPQCPPGWSIRAWFARTIYIFPSPWYQLGTWASSKQWVFSLSVCQPDFSYIPGCSAQLIKLKSLQSTLLMLLTRGNLGMSFRFDKLINHWGRHKRVFFPKHNICRTTCATGPTATSFSLKTSVDKTISC